MPRRGRASGVTLPGMDPPTSVPAWFAVRCLYELKLADQERDERAYEERITLWQAESFDTAIEQAEQEAAEYADGSDVVYLGLAQAFWLYDAPASGTEIFSLIRTSDLAPRSYIARHFETGGERQQTD